MAVKIFGIKRKSSNAFECLVKADTLTQAQKHLTNSFEISALSSVEVADLMSQGLIRIEDATAVAPVSIEDATAVAPVSIEDATAVAPVNEPTVESAPVMQSNESDNDRL